jgi:hypothetical protein
MAEKGGLVSVFNPDNKKKREIMKKTIMSFLFLFLTGEAVAGSFSGVATSGSKICLSVFQDASVESEVFQLGGSSADRRAVFVSVDASPGVCGLKLTIADPAGEYSTVDQTICLGDGGRLLPESYFSIPGNVGKKEEPAVYMRRVLCVSAEEVSIQDNPGPLVVFTKKLRINLETGYWVKEYPTANPSKLGETTSVLVSKKP